MLRYFDAMNFAGMIRCGTLIGLGLHDPVVPAETVYSIANHLSAPCEIMEFPVSHTDLPEEKRWEQFEARWLALGRGEAELRPDHHADAGLIAGRFRRRIVPWRVADFSLYDWGRFAKRISPDSAELPRRRCRAPLRGDVRRCAPSFTFAPAILSAPCSRAMAVIFRIGSVMSENSCIALPSRGAPFLRLPFQSRAIN